MGNYRRSLGLGKAVVQSPVEMADKLLGLTAHNERADSDEAAVARRKVWATPQIPEEHAVGVIPESGRDTAEGLLDGRHAQLFRIRIKRQHDLRAGGQLRAIDTASGEDSFGDPGG